MEYRVKHVCVEYNLHYYYYIQKILLKSFSWNVTCLLQKGFPMIFIHSQQSSILYTKLGLHIADEAALHFGLVFVWTVSLLMVVLVLLVFERSTRYSWLMGLVILVVDLDKCTFAPVTLVPRPSINLVNYS